MTIKSLSTAEIVYNTFWYTYPVDSQRLIVQMIQRGQTPFHLKGFDIVDCSLETFLKVNCLFSAFNWAEIENVVDDYLQFFRTAVSYYIIFRQFSN